MMLKKYKISVLGILFILIQVSSSVAQKRTIDERTGKTVTIDLKNIESEISNIFKIVSHEISKIDMREVGIAVEKAGREIGDIQITVKPEPCDQLSDENLVGTEIKKRTITKSYTVNQNDKLAINNQYGNIDIKVWSKNEIKVDVEIKAFESSEKSAADLLETVKINELRQNGLISFKTVFERPSHNSWTRIINGREEGRGVQVNYVVYMPSVNPLDISNKHGNTSMADFKGRMNLNSVYGNFRAGRLDNTANQVKVSYGTADIQSFFNGNIVVNYGTLKVDVGEKLNAAITHSPARITKLNSGGTFNVLYGSGLRIDEVDKNLKNLIINSTYAGVTLGLDKTANIDYDVTVIYNEFKFGNQKLDLHNHLTGTRSGFNPTKNYKGSIGKGTDSKIIVKSTYGPVKFL